MKIHHVGPRRPGNDEVSEALEEMVGIIVVHGLAQEFSAMFIRACQRRIIRKCSGRLCGAVRTIRTKAGDKAR
jgi:hypothetical protein